MRNKLEIDRVRMIIEIASFSLIAVFNFNLLYWLFRSGMRAFEFFVDYFYFNFPPNILFILVFMFSFTIFYITIKAIYIFIRTLKTEIFLEENNIIIKYNSIEYSIEKKDLNFKLEKQSIPKLTMGKRLCLLKIKIGEYGEKIIFAYEYLLDEDQLLKYLNER